MMNILRRLRRRHDNPPHYPAHVLDAIARALGDDQEGEDTWSDQRLRTAPPHRAGTNRPVLPCE